MTQLIVELADGRRKSAPLSQATSVRLGAEAGLELSLTGPGVLPFHALVRWCDDAWQIAASPAAGRITVNGHSLSAGPLQSGDVLRLGELELRLTFDETADAAPLPTPTELDLAPVASLSQFKPAETPPAVERPPAVPAAATDELGLAPVAGLSPVRPTPAPQAGVPSARQEPAAKRPPADQEELGLAASAGLSSASARPPEPPTPMPAPGRPADSKTAAGAAPKRSPNKGPPNPGGTRQPPPATADQPAQKPPIGSGKPVVDKPAAKPSPSSTSSPSAPTSPGGPQQTTAAAAAPDDLLGDLLASGSWDSAAPDLSTDPLLGGGGPLPAPPGLGSPPLATAPHAQAAAKPGTVRRTATWLLAMTPLALVAGLAAFIVWNLPSANRQWELALASYQAQDWSQAEGRLQAFAQAHPRHARAAEARILAGLCRVQPWVDSGADWNRAAVHLAQATQEWGALCWHPVAQAALARLTPPIAEALASACRTLEAQQEPAALRAALQDAQNALAVARRTLPDELFVETELAEAERTIEAIQARQRRADVARDAIAALQGATGQGNVADLAVMLSELQRDTPLKEFSPELTAAIEKFAAALPDQCSTGDTPEAPAALPAEAAPPLRLVCRRWAPDLASGGGPAAAILVPAVRSAYGVETATGRLLWRRCVGDGADYQPATPPGGNQAIWFLLNAARQRLEAVDSQTGAVVWALPRDALDPWPLLTESRCVQVTRGGVVDVRSIADGSLQGRLQLPQKVCAPPVAEADGAACWVAAEREFAYRLELEPLRCTHVLWLGQTAQGVSFRPIVHAERIAFLENVPRGGGRLHVVGGDPPRVLQRLELPERIAAPPVVWQTTSLLVSESGQMLTVQWRDDERAPAGLSQTAAAFEHPLPLAATERAVVMGGARALAFDATAEGATLHAELSLGPCRVEAVQSTGAGGWLLAVTTEDSPRRLYLAHWSAQADECTWLTELGLAAEALPPQHADAWRVVTAEGKLAALSEAPTELEPPAERQPLQLATHMAAVRDAARLFATGPHELVAAVEGRSWLLSTAPGATEPDQAFARVGAAQAACRDAAGRLWLGELGSAVHVFGSPAEQLGTGWLPGARADFAWGGCWPLANAQVQFVRADGLLTTWEIDAAGPRCVAQSQLDGPLQSHTAHADRWLWLFHGEQATAVSLDDGQFLAKVPVAASLAWGPQRIGQGVLAQFQAGRLYSLADREEPLWAANLSFRAPLVAGVTDDRGRLWLATSSGDVTALDALTGETVQPPYATAETVLRLYWHDDALWALARDGAIVPLALPEEGPRDGS